jgi:hypothetical protein
LRRPFKKIYIRCIKKNRKQKLGTANFDPARASQCQLCAASQYVHNGAKISIPIGGVTLFFCFVFSSGVMIITHHWKKKTQGGQATY